MTHKNDNESKHNPELFPSFDHEEFYDTTVQPLLSIVRNLCQNQGIPFFATACYKREEDGVHLASAGCPAKDGWVPVEFRMIRDIVDSKAAIIPLGKLMGEIFTEAMMKRAAEEEDK